MLLNPMIVGLRVVGLIVDLIVGSNLNAYGEKKSDHDWSPQSNT